MRLTYILHVKKQYTCTLYQLDIYTCTCTCTSVPLGERVELSNGHLKLLFNETGHLSSWSDLTTSVTYSLQHEYLQEVEKVGLMELNVCTGTNVYTFVPGDGSHVLTPKVHVHVHCRCNVLCIHVCLLMFMLVNVHVIFTVCLSLATYFLLVCYVHDFPCKSLKYIVHAHICVKASIPLKELLHGFAYM